MSKEDLSKEDLSKEDLSKEDLSKEDLSKEDLETLSISLNECIAQEVKDCDLSHYDFNGLILSHSRFTRVKFHQVEFIGTNLNDVVFDQCDFTDSSFVYAHLENTRFIDCILDQVKVLGTSLDSMIVDYAQERDQQNPKLDEVNLRFSRSYAVRSFYTQGYLYEVYYWPSVCRQDSSPSNDRPLILLHGMTGHALDYEPLAQRLSRPIYAINLLGHGKSDYQSVRTLSGALDVEADFFDEGFNEDRAISEHDERSAFESRKAPEYLEVVQQVKGLIEQITEIDRFTSFDVMGYSMGGRLALHIAYLFSQVSHKSSTLKTLLLVSTGLGIEEEQLRAARRVSDCLWSDALWHSQDTAHFLTLWNQQPLLARLADKNPQEASRINQHRRQHHARGLAIAFDSLGQGVMPPMHQNLSQINCDLVWVTGADDEKYVMIAEQALRLSKGQLEHISIEGCGHSPHLEALEQFCSKLSAQLATESNRSNFI